MKTVTLIINNCLQCPFCRGQIGKVQCLKADEELPKTWSEKYPSWCPLIEGEIISIPK